MDKHPSNRYALPKVIISEVDHERILEFKVKYEKLARLDRFEVKAMHYDGAEIVFDEVVANGGLIEVEYQDNNKTITINLNGKKYTINGRKVGGKRRLLEDRISRGKVCLELHDKIPDEKGNLRSSRTERELITFDSTKLYSQIIGRDVASTKEIYLIKRFLAYRSDLLFYYGFIDNFFKVAGNKRELWKIDFSGDKNQELIKYFNFTINDKLKNDKGYLKEYTANDEQIKKDLQNTKEVFTALRHALMHFEYDFFEKLFNNEEIETLSKIHDIELLNTMINKLDKLNIDTRKEYIDDEKITVFGEEISLKTLYGLYAHTAINRVAFNKLINRFMVENGTENEALKKYFNSKAEGGIAYEIDIHQNSEYKQLYIQHKDLVSKLSALSDGDEIADTNKKISELKVKMKAITKANSLKRLEHKLRLTFGFIYTEYQDYNAFKNNFDTDIKSGRFIPKDSEGKRRGFDHRELDQLKRYYDATFADKKPQTKETFDEIDKQIDQLSLKNLIGDDTLLKVILLIYIFLPREIKGEFLGFVKKYYHDTKHIEEDTKDKDEGFDDTFPVGLKLKVLDKNIRALSVLKHSLSYQAKYNKKEEKKEQFYEAGNRHGRFYKKLGISHNQEEFDKSVYAPLLRYHAALFKLLNDFEIYSLAQHIEGKETLAQQIEKPQFSQYEHYNFRKMLSKTYPKSAERGALDNDAFDTVINMRNDIAHLSHEPLFECPLDGKKSYKLKQGKRTNTINVKPLPISRKMIVDFISSQSDMKKTLGYDAVNDLTMKIIQLRTRLKVYADKSETIKTLVDAAKTPNDFYHIYKVKGVEAINRHLLEVIGETKDEKRIRKRIESGNAIAGRTPADSQEN